MFLPGDWDRMGRWKVTSGNRFSQGADRESEGPAQCSPVTHHPYFFSHPTLPQPFLPAILHFLNSPLSGIAILLPSLLNPVCCRSHLSYHFLQAAFLTPHMQVDRTIFASRVILQSPWENVQAVLAFYTVPLRAAVLWGRVVGAYTVLEFTGEGT